MESLNDVDNLSGLHHTLINIVISKIKGEEYEIKEDMPYIDELIVEN